MDDAILCLVQFLSIKNLENGPNPNKLRIFVFLTKFEETPKTIFQVSIFTRPLEFCIRYVRIIKIYDRTVALKNDFNNLGPIIKFCNCRLLVVLIVRSVLLI